MVLSDPLSPHREPRRWRRRGESGALGKGWRIIWRRRNDELCLLIQVESRTALENPDAILEVDGIDGVFIGPADLSASLGYPDDAGHPDVQRVIEQSIRALRAAGKAAGFLAVDPAMAEKCLAWGPTSVAVGVDNMLYTQALDRRLAHA